MFSSLKVPGLMQIMIKVRLHSIRDSAGPHLLANRIRDKT